MTAPGNNWFVMQAAASRSGPAILALKRGLHSQLRYCWWYRSSRDTDSDISEIASPVGFWQTGRLKGHGS